MVLNKIYFTKTLFDLKSKINISDKENLIHILKLDFICKFLFISGLIISLVTQNVLVVIIGSLIFTYGTLMQWAVVGHPVLHGAYDNIKNIPKYLTSGHYINPFIKHIHMFSWMNPKVWIFEHNQLHHGNIGTIRDPDSPLTKFKWLKHKSRMYKIINIIMHASLSGINYYGRFLNSIYKKKYNIDFFFNNFLPQFFRYFIILLLFYVYSSIYFGVVFLIGYEIFTGLLSFFIIAGTHAGKDLYYFTKPAKTKEDRILMEIMGTANYTNGNDFTDFLTGFLGYHIEHHIFPNETHLFYRKIQPLIKQLCVQNQIPYVEESFLIRCKKLVNTYAGDSLQKGDKWIN